MKKGMSKKLIVIFCLLGITLTGCATNTKIADGNDKAIETMVQNGDVKSVEDVVNKTIKNLSPQEKSDKVDSIVAAIHMAASNESMQVTGYGKELNEIVKSGFDVNSEEGKNKATSNALKGLLTDIKEKHLLVKNESEQFYVIPDLNYILEKYSKYMSDELKDVITFRNEENLKPLYNSDSSQLDLDLLVERELKVEDMMVKYAGGEYISQWKTYQAYYIDNLFGKNHGLFFTSDKKQITSYVLDKYKEIVEKHPDTVIGKAVKGYLDILNGSNAITDASNKYIDDTIDTFVKDSDIQTNQESDEDNNQEQIEQSKDGTEINTTESK